MKKLYLFICFVFLLFNVNSQFTYINVNGSYQGLALNSQHGGNLTGVKSFAISGSVISRFKSHFGAGAKVSFAVSQNFDFSFKNAETSSGYFLNKNLTELFSHDEFNRYYAEQFDYNVSYQNIISLFGRVYFDRYINSYSDISISYMKVSEDFTLVRSYRSSIGFDYNYRPEIPAENINFNETYNFISPGIRVGLAPHITDNLYLDFNLGLDFLFFKKNSFGYVVPYNYSPSEKWHQYVILESQASGLKTLFSVNLGVGFYF